MSHHARAGPPWKCWPLSLAGRRTSTSSAVGDFLLEFRTGARDRFLIMTTTKIIASSSTQMDARGPLRRTARRRLPALGSNCGRSANAVLNATLYGSNCIIYAETVETGPD